MIITQDTSQQKITPAQQKALFQGAVVLGIAGFAYAVNRYYPIASVNPKSLFGYTVSTAGNTIKDILKPLASLAAACLCPLLFSILAQNVSNVVKFIAFLVAQLGRYTSQLVDLFADGFDKLGELAKTFSDWMMNIKDINGVTDLAPRAIVVFVFMAFFEGLLTKYHLK